MAIAGAVDPFQGEYKPVYYSFLRLRGQANLSHFIHSESSVRPLGNVAGRSEKEATFLPRRTELVSNAESERPRIAAELEAPEQRPGNTRAGETSGDRDEILREMSALRETIHIVLAERAQHVDRQVSSPPSYQSRGHDGS